MRVVVILNADEPDVDVQRALARAHGGGADLHPTSQGKLRAVCAVPEIGVATTIPDISISCRINCLILSHGRTTPCPCNCDALLRRRELLGNCSDCEHSH